jgi:hypothetical protein
MRRRHLANASRATIFENLDLSQRRLVEDYVLIPGTFVAIFLSSYRPRSLLVDRRCQVVMLVAMSFALMPMAPAYPADVSALRNTYR